MRRLIVLIAVLAAGLALSRPVGGEAMPWPADVPGFVAPEPGEHPRLLFRKADLPTLRERAQTPEGQALIIRLRHLLDGKDGTTMPGNLGMQRKPDADGSGELIDAPEGSVLTISHAAGYGFLYQLTGEQRYAELGLEAIEAMLAGYRGRDRRYAYREPYGSLRAGPSLGWYALGYDLCYDGWDQATRVRIARSIAEYNEGRGNTLPELVRGSQHHPGSNHWGMQVGGGAMALLAVLGDAGTDDAKLRPLLQVSQRAMIRNLTDGFGDHGFFAEGDGPGSMSSHIIFLSALQAWRVAGGKDFVSPRPNAPWTTLKYIFLTIPRANGSLDFPKRGGYPHNVWARTSISGAGYFAIGFGAVAPQHRPALLWFYNTHLHDRDQQAQTPFDTTSPFPHHVILSFVNWPFDEQPVNPAQSLPREIRDTRYGFYAFRNRWQDEHDIVISQMTRNARGWIRTSADRGLSVWAHGRKETWGTIPRDVIYWQPSPDGSAIIGGRDGTWLAIDFCAASGADGLLIMTGPGAPAGGAHTHSVTAGDTTYRLRILTTEQPPAIRVEGDTLHIGHQTVTMVDGRMTLGTFAGPDVAWTAPPPQATPAPRQAAPRAPTRPAASEPVVKPAEEVSPEERVAAVRLNHARLQLAAGRTDDARRVLGQLIERWPQTQAATEAQQLLRELDAPAP